jgi:cytochrome P450
MSSVLSPARTSVAQTPGPKGRPLLGNILDIRRDPLSAIVEWQREYGDIVCFRLLFVPVYLVSDPDAIETVLVTESRNFRKSNDYRGLQRLLGNGLLTSEGEFWRAQRRLMQPAFHRERIAHYAEIMVDYAKGMLDEWRDGEVRNIHEDMMALTLRIVAKALFDADVARDAPEVGEALGEVMRNVSVETLFWPALEKIPTKRHRRSRRARSRLDGIIYRLIADRRRAPGGADLLSTLIRLRDEDGSSMTDLQLRDELMTLFLAGHETTALALSWTWLLLAEHPEVEAKLHAELDGVLHQRSPSSADLPRLPYVNAVLLESMRIYPPVWSIGRAALTPCTLGGHSIPAGAQIWMSQWINHHDARYFDAPDQFRPERWESDLRKRLPRYAYFPFGGGPRFCIGEPFAMVEAALLLATIAQRFQMRRVSNDSVGLIPSITLRPKNGIPLRIERRSLRAASAP